MLDQLKFVQGAVAKKELIPTLTHFKIEAGTIRSFNGSLALCTPIDLAIECAPKAVPFIKAIQRCSALKADDNGLILALTPAKRLSLKTGKFKAFIDCTDDETPHVTPQGDTVVIDGDVLLKAIKTVAPFISDDAARPWSNGVLLKGHSAFATNNIALIEYWTGIPFPITCNIPRDAIRELIRVNEPPVSIQATDKSISFNYADGKWIYTSLLNTDWPDLNKILDVKAHPEPIISELYKALDALEPFVDSMDRVYIDEGVIATSVIACEGASYELSGFHHKGVFQLNILKLLKNIATSIDFSSYPKPCVFYGEQLRGAIIGMKV